MKLNDCVDMYSTTVLHDFARLCISKDGVQMQPISFQSSLKEAKVSHIDISIYVRCAFAEGTSYYQTHLMEGGTEANESRHDTPKEATKGNYMCSVVLVTKHTTNWRCCGLHMQSVCALNILQIQEEKFPGLKSYLNHRPA